MEVSTFALAGETVPESTETVISTTASVPEMAMVSPLTVPKPAPERVFMPEADTNLVFTPEWECRRTKLPHWQAFSLDPQT